MFNRLFSYIILCFNLIVLASPTGKSSELNHHKMLKNLVKLYNHKLTDIEANRIASAVLKINRNESCQASWDLIVSIAIAESSLNTKAYNWKTKDYGIMQINEKMIKRLNLDKSKLMKDINYSFDTACKIITENRTKYSSKRPYWIGIYNSGVAFNKPVVIRNAKKYDKKIKTLLREIHIKSAQLYSLEN